MLKQIYSDLLNTNHPLAVNDCLVYLPFIWSLRFELHSGGARTVFHEGQTPLPMDRY